MKDCCIIIPIYNVNPTPNEIMSIKRNCTVLNNFDIYFIHPFFMNVSAYEEIIIDLFKSDIANNSDLNTNNMPSVSDFFSGRIKFIPFKKKYFKSNKTYSRLLLSPSFYRPFASYEFMLIAQTDTYILNTSFSLEDFIKLSRDKSYDYWGAPWPNGPFSKPYSIKDYFKLAVVKNPSQIHVGNGGFTLRHIQNTYSLIIKKKNLIDFYWRFNEDMFFSYFASLDNIKYNAAPLEEANKFALEANMAEELTAGHIPYAVHAWEKYISEEELLKHSS